VTKNNQKFRFIKESFEKMAYAGMKPQRPGAPSSAPKSKWAASIRARLEARLTQPGSSDPLYLSNRTLSQRFGVWSGLAIPAVIAIVGLGLVLTGFFNKRHGIAPPPAGLSDAEIADRMLPDLKKLQVVSQHDLDIRELKVVTGTPSRVMGIATNNTDHEIAKAELTFDLADTTGSRQGAVSTELTNIASRASMPFQFPIEATTASLALVRDVRVQ
jgi:hypothetical protein